MSQIKNAMKNSYFVLTLSIFSIFIGYLFRIFLSRSLSIADFGLFYAVGAFIGLFTLVRYLGLNSALVKYIPEFLVKNDKNKIKTSVTIILVIQTLTVLIFTSVILMFHNNIASSLFKASAADRVLILMALSFLPSLFFVVFQSVFQGYQKLRTYALVEPVRISLTFLLSVALISMGVEGVALAYLIAAILTTLVFFYSFYKLGIMNAKMEITSGILKKILKFSMPIFVSSIAIFIITYTDTIVITFYRSLEEVALYQVAMPTSQLLLIFSGSIAAVAFPLISELHARKKFGEIQKSISVIITVLVFLILPFVILLVSFPEIIIKFLFGDGFLSAAITLQILTVSMIFYSIFTVLQTTLDGIGRPFINTKILFLMAGANLVLNIALVPIYGITGSAVASLTAYLIGVVVGFGFVRKLLNISLPFYKLAKVSAGAIISTGIIYLLRPYVYIPIYQQFAVLLVIGWVFYFAFVIFSKAVTANDIAFMETANMPKTLRTIAKLIFRR
ncbi:MAG: flippase [Candidatus Aenigmatarchaeota archaeon]